MSFGVLKDTYGLPQPTSQVHVMSQLIQNREIATKTPNGNLTQTFLRGYHLAIAGVNHQYIILPRDSIYVRESLSRGNQIRKPLKLMIFPLPGRSKIFVFPHLICCNQQGLTVDRARSITRQSCFFNLEHSDLIPTPHLLRILVAHPVSSALLPSVTNPSNRCSNETSLTQES